MTKFIFSTALFLGLTSAASADIVNMDDTIVQGGLCVGDNCVDGENFDLADFDAHLRLKGSFPMIEFLDISGSGSPDRDWRIQANEKGGGAGGEAFFIEDMTEGTTPFYIEGGAPDDAVLVRSDGSVGLGAPNGQLNVLSNGRVGINTQFPQEDLHIVAGDSFARFILEADSVATGAQQWEIQAGTQAMLILDRETNTFPFAVRNAAPNWSLFVDQSGYVGLGTDSPSAPLEVSSENAFNFFRITATGAAVNDSVDITFTGGPLSTGQLRYNIVDGDSQEMSLDADGNMVLDGTLTTAEPTCASGCDRVFDADYPLPSIAEHADQMFSLGYLPNIGATVPHAPVNLSERQGNIINALEHAHIYIDQLNDKIDMLEALRAEDARREAALLDRLARIEVQLAQ